MTVEAAGAAPLERVDRRRVADLVADQLLESISDGKFAPGSQLPTEPELARMLGVGRTSLREAVQRLRTLGVVEVRKGLGTFVVDGTSSDPIMAFAAWSSQHRYEIAELLETRMAIELAAAPLAAERASRPVIAELRGCALAHVEADRAGDLAELVRTDQEFHSQMVSASGNQLLARMYGMLVPQLLEYRERSLAIPGAPRRSGTGHLAVVEAIEKRDLQRSRAAILDHLMTLYDEFVDAARPRGSRGKKMTREVFGAGSA
jgi:GntR family transcriptional repressor for pyruvate dehydrogenase complex